MDARSQGSNAEFIQIMTASARRISSGSEPPYEGGIRLMRELGRVLTEADYAGAAYEMWGWLTDGIDGPPAYARQLTSQQIEDLMRLAASEWLALDPKPEHLRRYFERWRNWPDFPGAV